MRQGVTLVVHMMACHRFDLEVQKPEQSLMVVLLENWIGGWDQLFLLMVDSQTGSPARPQETRLPRHLSGILMHEPVPYNQHD